eukprot:GHVS01030942.1.p1 GENE.GHVS01030942.1~~GHVS01030942.1.p1  ORF type:complete len:269 (+),score=19.65 GHVS01030942.1:1-807(+)
MTPLEREIIHREMVAPRTDMTPLEREIIHREMVTPITNMTATEREIILREMVTPSPGMTLLEREIIGREMFTPRTTMTPLESEIIHREMVTPRTSMTPLEPEIIHREMVTPRTAVTPLEREMIDRQMVDRFEKEMIDRERMGRKMTRLVPGFPVGGTASSLGETVEVAYERMFPFTSFIMKPEDLQRKTEMSGTYRMLPLRGSTIMTTERPRIIEIPSESSASGETTTFTKQEKKVVKTLQKLLPRIAESLEDTETNIQQQRMRGHGL